MNREMNAVSYGFLRVESRQHRTQVTIKRLLLRRIEDGIEYEHNIINLQ